ncbi:hypothetical protein GYMLUDRAFT_241860 [Collybiopsis luxurians FD-317 M1]|uniref:Uncharacterized protein n=1 Tax=Collybiopsis luxurians FD-317 M1 TaxID=944289 RepID=A0A0D0D2D1_9AGAR|nr:hypothetical protein GYMLUDRAFT_241860 [Collybiopsis luxurians FD-317 M1]
MKTPIRMIPSFHSGLVTSKNALGVVPSQLPSSPDDHPPPLDCAAATTPLKNPLPSPYPADAGLPASEGSASMPTATDSTILMEAPKVLLSDADHSQTSALHSPRRFSTKTDGLSSGSPTQTQGKC